MATKRTKDTSTVEGSDSSASDVADAFRAPRKGKLTLKVSHGSKAGKGKPASHPKPERPMPPPPARASVPPARPRRTTRTAPSSGDAAKLALSIAQAALEKKASNVEIIDLAGKADYADYLVVMTGGSDRHVRALADGIQEELTKTKTRPLSVEGVSAGSWVLIDYGNVVAHVFQESTRSLYDIEGLWLDASRVPIP